ncbi:MAG: hypothetical protein AAF141_05855 [Pseudomonadota bacterium]
MIFSKLVYRLRGEGIGGSTTLSRVVYGAALGLSTLAAWWVFHGVDTIALIHSGLTVPAGWLAMTWGHGAFQNPHEQALPDIDRKIQEEIADGLPLDKAIEEVTTEKHSWLTSKLFGTWQQNWPVETKIRYQVAGMSETGVIRQACFALPDLLLNPLHIVMSMALGLLAGPLYLAGWAIWVWSVDDIDEMYREQRPIRGFLYNGDHVGDLLHGMLWSGTRWLSVAMAPSVFWLASAGFFNGG